MAAIFRIGSLHAHVHIIRYLDIHVDSIVIKYVISIKTYKYRHSLIAWLGDQGDTQEFWCG